MDAARSRKAARVANAPATGEDLSTTLVILKGMAVPALTVVYDSGCGVCAASVRWLAQRDRRAAFAFVGNDAPALPPGVSREEAQAAVVVVDGQRKWTGAAAVARLLRELPAWSPLGLFLALPGVRAAAAAGYAAFAPRRHRVSALLGLESCAVTPGRGPPEATAPRGRARGSRP
jgi:predicted DCC family thiol-disulfide oxidoreductase YuxK